MPVILSDDDVTALTRILEKITRKTDPVEQSSVHPPISERMRAPRYPLREDPGTVFRSKPGYAWVCPYCLKPILEGDMVIAFQAKPDARTTYAHLECDRAEEDYLRSLED
jgi:hypothetical protein